MLAHVLGRDRSYLYTWPERTLDRAGLARYQALLEARAGGRPLAQLTGEREFWSLTLQVDQRVLSPRPETELLVETALALETRRAIRVLDLGTGSGAIALALASERPHWRFTATDRSADALVLAGANARRHGVADRIEFRRGDWFGALADDRFELILANPPYIAENDPHLRDPALRHEPREALSGGADGLDELRRIVAGAAAWLAAAGGWLMLEHGWNQGPAVRRLLLAAGWRSVHSRRDLAGQERISLGRRPATAPAAQAAPARGR